MTTRSSTTTVDETEAFGSTGGVGTAGAGIDGGEQQHPLAEAGHEATESVGMLAERATSIGFQQADRVKGQAADGILQVSESIRRASSDIETEQPAIANVVTTAADQGERLAEYLRTTDAREMLQTVEQVARRQPLLFLGGAFLLGLAASRFIKAAGGDSAGGQGGYRTVGSYRGASAQWGGVTGQTSGYEATGPGGTGVNGTAATRADEGI